MSKKGHEEQSLLAYLYGNELIKKSKRRLIEILDEGLQDKQTKV